MAPQNVCQKFTFVKVLNVVCGKMARNGLKMANSQHCDFLRYPVFSCFLVLHKLMLVFSWSIFIRAVIGHMICYNSNWPKGGVFYLEGEQKKKYTNFIKSGGNILDQSALKH